MASLPYQMFTYVFSSDLHLNFYERSWRSWSILNAPPPQCWHSWQASQLPRQLNIVETHQILICLAKMYHHSKICQFKTMTKVEWGGKWYSGLPSRYKVKAISAIRKNWNSDDAVSHSTRRSLSLSFEFLWWSLFCKPEKHSTALCLWW